MIIIILLASRVNLIRPQNTKHNNTKKSQLGKIASILSISFSIYAIKTGVALALGTNLTIPSEFPKQLVNVIPEETGAQALKKFLKFQTITGSLMAVLVIGNA